MPIGGFDAKMAPTQNHPEEILTEDTAALDLPSHFMTVRALLVGQRIDTKNLEQGSVLATAPLTIRAGRQGRAVVFRYGVVVLFDLDPLEEDSFLVSLKRLVIDPIDPPEAEETRIYLQEDGEDRVERSGAIILTEPDSDRLQLIADILGKNAALDHYEKRVAAVFDRIEPLAATLQRNGKFGTQGKELLQQIGGVLLTQQRMVGRVEVLEKPEVLWERPNLERIYLKLEDEYELRERSRVLDRKLDLIARTSETLLDLVQSKRTMRVEWYIVALIMVEIIITVVDMTVRLHS
jgi:uncharacterized Rmd1/YagE family protein